MDSPLFRKSVSLKKFNTFGIDSVAEAFLEIGASYQLLQLSSTIDYPRPWRVLGGGSNLLLAELTAGTVLKNSIKGISLLEENENSVVVRVGSGENWHAFVMFAVGRGWAGIENLALIPGTVGAAPIQNIGAYGVEVKDAIKEVELWLFNENRFETISNVDCKFDYRDSIFKSELKGRFFICAVTFQLSKIPKFHMEYGAIKEELELMKCSVSLSSIAQAVMNIRRSKLPDPNILGNAGSFFKNPSISAGLFAELKKRFPLLPGYPGTINSSIKVSAAWLIEQCGWKGFKAEHVGVHDKQALVLVNFGDGTGVEIWQLSETILLSVQEKFGILLEREVQVW